jgi:hypothetical protein
MPVTNITSLAALKRHLQPGVRFRCLNSQRPQASGPRTVVKAQTNAIEYEYIDRDGRTGLGWNYWTKSDLLAFNGDRVSFLDAPGGRPVFTYIFGEAE